MKEFRCYSWVLIASIASFCISVYATIAFSKWFLVLMFLSIVWVAEMVMFTIKFLQSDYVLEEEERTKISRTMEISWILFIILGLINGIISLSIPGILTAIIGLFMFICFVLSVFFGLIVKKSRKKHWQKKSRSYLVETFF